MRIFVFCFLMMPSLFLAQNWNRSVMDSIFILKDNIETEKLLQYAEGIEKDHPLLYLEAKASAYFLLNENKKSQTFSLQLDQQLEQKDSLYFSNGLRIVDNYILENEIILLNKAESKLSDLFPLTEKYSYGDFNMMRYYLVSIRLLYKKYLNSLKINVTKMDDNFQKAIFYASRAQENKNYEITIKGHYFLYLKLAKEYTKGQKMALEMANKNKKNKFYYFLDYCTFSYLKKEYQRSCHYSDSLLIRSFQLPYIQDKNEEKLFDYYNLKEQNYNTILKVLFGRMFFFYKDFEQSGDSVALKTAFRAALDSDYFLDKTYLTMSNNRNKLRWRKKASESYFMGAFLSHAMGDEEKVHYFIEKNKSLFLLDRLALQSQKQSIPDSVMKANQTLKAAVFDYEFRVDAGEQLVDSTMMRYLKLREALNRQEEAIFAKYPTFKSTEIPKLLSIAAVQEKLQENQVSLSYIWDMDEDDFDDAFAFLISKEKTLRVNIKGIKRLKTLVQEYRQQLVVPFKTKQDQAQFFNTASALFSTLIPPEAEAMLQGKEVLLVGDAALQGIPFEALVSDLESQRYWIQDCTISYVNSLTYYFSKQDASSERIGAKKPFLAFAPVDFPQDSLLPLPNAEKEVTTAQAIFGGTPKLREAASLETFRTALPKASIVHLATHAKANKADPWIAFYQEKLYSHDLYTMENQADLITLSACETASGNIVDGEGVMSLSRGFFHSGAKSVLSSLWAVDDRSTATIMTDFYVNLKAGQSKNKAIRQAKIDYLNTATLSDRSPHYWAPFVLVGDTSPIVFDSPFSWVYLLFLVPILGLVWWFFKRRKAGR